MSTYKITFKQQTIVAAQSILTLSAIILISNYFANSIGFWANISILSFILVFDTLPSFVLHIQYYMKNKGAQLIINKDDRRIVYTNSNININLSFNEIENIQYFVSFGRKTGVYSFAVYRYYKITFNDSTNIFITCLMINDIENTLERQLNFNSKKQLRFICFLPFGQSGNI